MSIILLHHFIFIKFIVMLVKIKIIYLAETILILFIYT